MKWYQKPRWMGMSIQSMLFCIAFVAFAIWFTRYFDLQMWDFPPWIGG